MKGKKDVAWHNKHVGPHWGLRMQCEPISSLWFKLKMEKIIKKKKAATKETEGILCFNKFREGSDWWGFYNYISYM